MTIRVFGGMGVDDGTEPVSIGGPRQRRLLALLAIRAGSVVSIDWLAEHLWNDDERPEATAPALRTYVSRLRQSFPDECRDWVSTEPSGYRLDAPRDAVEHRRFSALRSRAADARRGEDPQTALGLLEEALALWRGAPFRELEDLDWARADIEQLELDRLEMLEERWEAALALGRHTQITGELAAFTAEHDLRERAIRQHALALHRSGRTTEALRVIDDFRRRVVNRSGLDASPELVELEAAILRGDASLAVEKVGRPLRGYRLLEEIGVGAFSVVWRGLQPSVDREVAIKQIRSELATQPEFIRRFEAEAHLVARIEHPHIVPLIDYWRDPDSAYLVMRWLRGGTLERRLDDGPLTVDETVGVAQQVGGALAAAHHHGVIHRDVKAANVLFDEAGNAYLADFGIALEATKSSGVEAALSPGSPAYASPEQIRRERLGPQADVFSLAVVLFECLIGALPFSSFASVDELIDRQLHTPFPSLTELRADVPPSVASAIERATSKDPAARFESIDEFLAALGGSATAPEPRAAAPDDVENPYKGLLAFDDGDEAAFFGREAFVAETLDRLGGTSLASRCLVVVGPSGSGKSSVVRAGLVPAVRAGGVAGSDDWFVTTMVPRADAFESLEAALLRVAVNPPSTLLDQLRDGERGILRSVRRCLPGDDGTVLLVIDQFEELFTAGSPTDAHDFLGALAVAVQDPQSPLRLVATLRADYYDRPLEHPAFAPVLKQTALDLTPLAPHELEQAIVEPARRVGVRFEPGLVARIAAETIGQPSPLPLLQYALSELFERRSLDELTIAAYEEIGGLTGALAARAEAIHETCSPEEQSATRRVFGRLTSPGEDGHDLRRRVPVEDLGPDAAVASVLERFGTARLLAFDRDQRTREPTVEVAHEALLREWPRLVSWLAEDRQMLRSVDAVASAASVWDAGGRNAADLLRGDRLETAGALVLAAPERLRALDEAFIAASSAEAARQRDEERRRIGRLRRLVVGVGAALLAALIAGAFAFRAQQQADDRAAEADLASIISRSAALSDEDPTVSVLLALEANRREDTPETQQAVMNALGSSTAANRVIAHGPLATADCPGGLLPFDGFHEFGLVDGVLTRRDLNTGSTSSFGEAAAPCVYWAADPELDFRIQLEPNGRRVWFGTYDGEPTPRDFPGAFDVAAAIGGVGGNGLMPAVVRREEANELLVLDARSGETIAGPFPGLALFGGGADISADGSIAAFSTGEFGRPEGGGNTLIVDTSTGQVLHDIDTPLPAAHVAIDERSNELVLLDIGGGLTTIAIETGQVVAETAVPIGDGAPDLEIRPDGSLAVVTAGEVLWVDRRSGLIDSVAELRDIVWAVYRPDDTIVVVTTADRIEVLDLASGALIERSYEISADERAWFRDGRAGVWGQDPFARIQPTVIDLDTGTRTDFDLRDADGSPFVPLTITPEDNGLLAVNGDGVIGRWVGDQQVGRLDLGEEATWFTRPMGRWWSLALGGSNRVVMVDLAELVVRYTIDLPEPWANHPTADGGLHVFDRQGRLRSFDADGSEIGSFATELRDVDALRVHPTSGLIVAEGFGAWQGIALVDAATETITPVLEGSRFAGADFAADGKLLAISGLDGTVRLWDIERDASAGLAWNGASATEHTVPWYDASTDSLWVNTAGQLVEIPLDPERWIAKACAFAGRDFTTDEWSRFVPGGSEVRSACS